MGRRYVPLRGTFPLVGCFEFWCGRILMLKPEGNDNDEERKE